MCADKLTSEAHREKHAWRKIKDTWTIAVLVVVILWERRSGSGVRVWGPRHLFSEPPELRDRAGVLTLINIDLNVRA